MQARTNPERSAATKAQLIAAARALFVEKGYADTATPDIAAAAGVTRGALYHHFADKRALFAAVLELEAAAVAQEIEDAAPASLDALEALLAGSRAYLASMQAPGRTRLLLLDGPAVLGRSEMDAVEGRHGNRTLREGLEAAMAAGALPLLPLDPLTGLLAAMFDRAALAVADGAAVEDQMAVVAAVLAGLAARA